MLQLARNKISRRLLVRAFTFATSTTDEWNTLREFISKST